MRRASPRASRSSSAPSSATERRKGPSHPPWQARSSRGGPGRGCRCSGESLLLLRGLGDHARCKARAHGPVAGPTRGRRLESRASHCTEGVLQRARAVPGVALRGARPARGGSRVEEPRAGWSQCRARADRTSSTGPQLRPTRRSKKGAPSGRSRRGRCFPPVPPRSPASGRAPSSFLISCDTRRPGCGRGLRGPSHRSTTLSARHYPRRS